MKKIAAWWRTFCAEQRILAGCLILLANWVLVPLALLTWRAGAMVWGLYLLLQIGVTCLDFRFVRSPWTMALLGVNHAAATALAHRIAGRLYYTHISQDYLSGALPELALQAGVVLVATTTIGAMVLKWKENWK